MRPTYSHSLTRLQREDLTPHNRMIVRYVVSNDAECDAVRIRDILNSGQSLFSLSPQIPLNLTTLHNPEGKPLDHHALSRFLSRSLPFDASEKPILLITGREINAWPQPNSHGFSTIEGNRLTIISNYRSSLEGNPGDLIFVRRILHNMTRLCVEKPSGDPGCVCGPGDDFVYLSGDGEKELRRLGYRDGIRDLLRFINWLNQAATAPEQPALKPLPFQDLPLVARFAKAISRKEGRPFDGKIVLMVLHFLSDLVPFIENVIRLGAHAGDIYLVAKPYPYPARDKISHMLEMMGVQFSRATEEHSVRETAADVLAILHKRKDVSRRPIIVIEDGGYFAPLLHRAEHRKLRDRCRGIVEQTTKGIRNTQRMVGKNIRIPILSVAQSTFKERYESPEIGRATVQNISRFVSNVKLSGRRAVVFGFGSIGAFVAENLNRSFNMGVSVVDTDPEKLLLANHRKDIVTEAKRAFSLLAHKEDTILVVGTTGGGKSGKPSVTAKLMSTFPDGTILVSTSSDRAEFDVKGLEKLAKGREEIIEEGNRKYTINAAGKEKALFLLAEGYPINFYGSDSVPNETIDPIMALLLLCAVRICQKRRKFSTKIDVEAVNEITGPKGRNLAAKYSAITARH